MKSAVHGIPARNSSAVDCIPGDSECRECEQDLQPAVFDAQRRHEVLQTDHDTYRCRRHVGN
jgi:hypothetical protein